MNIKDNFKNLLEKAQGMDRKQIGVWRYTLIFLIIVDIFGIFWYLHLKKLGIALMVVFLIGLGFIMFLESKLPKEETTEPPKVNPNKRIPPGAKRIIKKEKEVKKMPEEETAGNGEQEDDGFSFGLPSSEEYNKRLNDAFEFKGLGVF